MDERRIDTEKTEHFNPKTLLEGIDLSKRPQSLTEEQRNRIAWYRAIITTEILKSGGTWEEAAKELGMTNGTVLQAFLKNRGIDVAQISRNYGIRRINTNSEEEVNKRKMVIIKAIADGRGIEGAANDLGISRQATYNFINTNDVDIKSIKRDYGIKPRVFTEERINRLKERSEAKRRYRIDSVKRALEDGKIDEAIKVLGATNRKELISKLYNLGLRPSDYSILDIRKDREKTYPFTPEQKSKIISDYERYIKRKIYSLTIRLGLNIEDVMQDARNFLLDKLDYYDQNIATLSTFMIKYTQFFILIHWRKMNKTRDVSVEEIEEKKEDTGRRIPIELTTRPDIEIEMDKPRLQIPDTLTADEKLVINTYLEIAEELEDPNVVDIYKSLVEKGYKGTIEEARNVYNSAKEKIKLHMIGLRNS